MKTRQVTKDEALGRAWYKKLVIRKTVKGMRETFSHIRALAEECTDNGGDGYGKIMEWCDLHKD